MWISKILSQLAILSVSSAGTESRYSCSSVERISSQFRTFARLKQEAAVMCACLSFVGQRA